MANVTEFVRQAAALPIKAGKICLITSSNGKRWIIPKGLIEPGQTAAENALQEAWEEAGLVGSLQREPVENSLTSARSGTSPILTVTGLACCLKSLRVMGQLVLAMASS